MTYRISYDKTGVPRLGDPSRSIQGKVEEFRTEYEALKRARELLEAGDRHAVAVDDGFGNVLHGVRLHLRLGYNAAD